jgi:hypothetical protein
MRVGLEHIDPQIAAAMRERLCASGLGFLKENIRWADAEEGSLIRLFLNQALHRAEQRQPEDPERLAYMVHRQREKMASQRVGIAVGAALVGGGLIGMMFYTLMDNLWLGVGIGLAAGIGALAFGGYWAWQATSQHELHYEVTVSEFEAVVPLLSLSDMEAAYCDMLTRVCEHDPNQEARRAVRRHLHKMKEFVTLGRQLELLADAAEQNEQPEALERVETALEKLIAAIHAITDALCTVLVVPSPAGDRASELIDKELAATRQAVEVLAAEATAIVAVVRKRRREKVS